MELHFLAMPFFVAACFFSIRTEASTSSASDEPRVDSESVSFFVRESFRLSCGSLLGEAGSIVWKLNDVLVNDQKGGTETMDDSSLMVANASLGDAGRYACFAANGTTAVAVYLVSIKGNSKAEKKVEGSDEVQAEQSLSPERIQAEHSQLKEHLLSRLDSVEADSMRERQKTSVRVRELESKLASLSSLVHKMEARCGEEATSLLKDESARPNDEVARLKLVDGQFVSEFVWIVAGYWSHLTGAAKGSGKKDEDVLTSRAFYTHEPGYRMQLTLYPNYKASNYTALFASLLPGEFDDVVPWPFPHDFRLEVVSHRPGVANDAATIRLSVSNCGHEAFSRPEARRAAPGCGFRQFVSNEKLRRRNDAFVLNGSLVVRMHVFVAKPVD